MARSPRKASPAVRVTRTARDSGERLTKLPAIRFAATTAELASVMVDPAVQYQEIEGFGGAFTEAAAVTLLAMPKAAQEEILRAYFDPARGHGYTLCRTHINSCDFGTGNYALDEVAGDVKLEHFSIDRDKKALIPMIKRAQKISGGRLRLFASPWSPPPWMKTNGEMDHGGKLKPEYRQVWADYYVKYLRAYEREGIKIWGLTVQNEPEADQPFDSCIWTGEEERDFVRDHLGPTLAKAGYGHLRLMVWDHNRDRMYERAKLVYDDAAAAKYVWGTAFHWYEGECFDNVQFVHDAWPEKKLLFTEGCVRRGPAAGLWDDGEKYGRHMIKDLNHWAVGWTDWNMLLDMEGGPRHCPGRCSAPILGDVQTGEPRYEPAYYFMGHFTRFIKPGARRVIGASSRAELEVTAFINPDGTVVAVVLNRSSEELPFALKFGAGAADTVSPPHSITTYCIEGA
jgi:glucosylceramidase